MKKDALNPFFFWKSIVFQLPLICFPVFTMLAYAEDIPNVSKKHFEFDRDKDGKVDFRMETHSRAGKRIFTEQQRRISLQNFSVTRSYFISGELTALEEDNDGDGFFETLLVFRSGAGKGSEFDGFLRSRTGSVQAIDVKTKEAYRKMFTALDDFWSNAPKSSYEPELIEKARKDIDAAVENAN